MFFASHAFTVHRFDYGSWTTEGTSPVRPPTSLPLLIERDLSLNFFPSSPFSHLSTTTDRSRGKLKLLKLEERVNSSQELRLSRSVSHSSFSCSLLAELASPSSFRSSARNASTLSVTTRTSRSIGKRSMERILYRQKRVYQRLNLKEQ